MIMLFLLAHLFHAYPPFHAARSQLPVVAWYGRRLGARTTLRKSGPFDWFDWFQPMRIIKRMRWKGNRLHGLQQKSEGQEHISKTNNQ